MTVACPGYINTQLSSNALTGDGSKYSGEEQHVDHHCTCIYSTGGSIYTMYIIIYSLYFQSLIEILRRG